ncbi:MAG: PocR ligand-binding domain-containing protein, partial [Myxococcales bacterium]|nr:PocR ligand-binding domain-containing protein [Myxococcales bacterium]
MEATEGGGMDLELGDISSVEDVLDREALVEVCRGVYDLFGLSVRILSPGGALLGQARDTPDICAYLNTLPGGRAACSQTVSQAQAHVPGRAA